MWMFNFQEAGANEHEPENIPHCSLRHLQRYIILITSMHTYKSRRPLAITVVIMASNLLRSQMIPTMPNIKAAGDEKIRSNPPRAATGLPHPGLHISITTIVAASKANNAADIFPNRTLKSLQRVSSTGFNIHIIRSLNL